MVVDEDTKDAFGHRKSGAQPRDELVIRVYADPTSSNFTFYEDDGLTVRYDQAGRPAYSHRTTRISQIAAGPTGAIVHIDPAVDSEPASPYAGAPMDRTNIIELIVEEAKATSVSLNGTPLVQRGDQTSFDFAPNGWFNARHNRILRQIRPPARECGEGIRLQPVL